MIDEHEHYPQSLVFDVASMALRLIPRGRQRVFYYGDDLFTLFNSLYKDVHPEMTAESFTQLLREIFPVYKNPRKNTVEFKITTHQIGERLSELGIRNFPTETLVNKEVLQLEL